MKMDRATGKQFTGRHMLAIMFAFFGVIIAVNITMAVKANTTWTGFVVKNTYIASQEFNSRAQEGRKQTALNWTSSLEIADGQVRYSLVDTAGSPVILSGGSVNFKRPSNDREDMTVALAVEGTSLNGVATVADGVWIIEVLADAGLENPYRDTQRVHVRGGALR